MLKIIDRLAGLAAAFVWAAVFYGASTSYANAQMPPWLQRPTPQVIVCASLADVKDVATQDTISKDGADFSTLLNEGKCARVPGPLVNFYWYFDEYKDGNGITGYIAEVAFNGYPKHLYTITASLPKLIDVTWKEAFKDHSKALAWWFKSAKPTDWAQKKYELYACCEYAERVKTKFELRQGDKYGSEEWVLQCTQETRYFCNRQNKNEGDWALIPAGIIHEEEIQTPSEYWENGGRFYVGEVEMPKVKQEFEQLRTEGVIFFYNSQPVCFWPPETRG